MSGATETGADVSVRPATSADVPLILDMIHELAKYEGETSSPQFTADDLLRDGFESPAPWFFVLVAECEGAVVGHALCNRAFSTRKGRAYYVEDLFVRPSARGRGVGRRLLQELCRMAVRVGVHRMDWHVLDSNTSALRFYERLGALDLRAHDSRSAMRLYRAGIEALAADAPAE